MLIEQLLELAMECTTLQSSLVLTLLVCEFMSVHIQKAQFWGDWKSVKLMKQLLALVKECTTLQSSVTLHAVRDSSSEEFTELLLEQVRKRTTLQPSISQLDLMLENVLQTRCQDLTSAVDQIKVQALQPLNVQPLFLTGNHAVQLLSPLSNKFEMCTNPQPVHNVLNNIRKSNNLW